MNQQVMFNKDTIEKENKKLEEQNKLQIYESLESKFKRKMYNENNF